MALSMWDDRAWSGFAEISFKGNRKAYFSYTSLNLRPGLDVIVEADQGKDLGKVTAVGVIAERKCSSSNGGCATPAPEQKVIRIAHSDDIGKSRALRKDEDRAVSYAHLTLPTIYSV